MALQRFEGTSFVDAGLSRRGMSLVGNVISRSGLAVATDTTTNEQVLFTSNLPNKLLNNNGKGLLISALGNIATDANNKRIRIRLTNLTGTLIADSGLFGGSSVGGGFIVQAYIYRTGASAQDCLGVIITNSGVACQPFVQTTVNSSSGIQFVITGQNGTGGVANELVLRVVAVALITEGGVQTASGVLV